MTLTLDPSEKNTTPASSCGYDIYKDLYLQFSGYGQKIYQPQINLYTSNIPRGVFLVLLGYDKNDKNLHVGSKFSWQPCGNLKYPGVLQKKKTSENDVNLLGVFRKKMLDYTWKNFTDKHKNLRAVFQKKRLDNVAIFFLEEISFAHL